MFAWLALTPLIVAVLDVHRGRPRVPGASRVSPRIRRRAGIFRRDRLLDRHRGLAIRRAALAGGYRRCRLCSSRISRFFLRCFTLCLDWLAARHGRRAILLAPAIWVTTELGRTYFWSGFPWLLLGYSQTTVLPVAQLASVVGVFGLSVLVAAISSTVAYFVLTRSTGSVVALGIAAAALAGITLWGNQRLRERYAHGRRTPGARGARPGQHSAGREVGSPCMPPPS